MFGICGGGAGGTGALGGTPNGSSVGVTGGGGGGGSSCLGGGGGGGASGPAGGGLSGVAAGGGASSATGAVWPNTFGAPEVSIKTTRPPLANTLPFGLDCMRSCI